MNGFKSSRSYKEFACRIQRERRFFRSTDDEEFLRKVVETSKNRVFKLEQGEELWRAQLGFDWQEEKLGDECIDEFPVPFKPERMKPKPEHAKDGRANSCGIVVLYLASAKKTAMSEVRPWIGALVSCARLETVRPLTLVDLSRFHDESSPYYFQEPDIAGREKAVWTDIDKAFSKPVTSGDEIGDYVPTQVLTELFKEEGFDGIVYKSNFGDIGYNITLFNPDDARITACGLYEVESVALSFKESGNPCHVSTDGKCKTITVSDYGPVGVT